MAFLTDQFVMLITDREATNMVAGWLAFVGDAPMLALGLIGLVLVVRRQIHRWVSLGILLFAYLIGASDLPLGLVTAAMGEVFPRLAGQNTAVVVMLFLAITTLLLSIITAVPGWRSRDRFVVAVAGWAMLVTTTVFHVVVIHGMMMQGFRLEEERLAKAAPLSSDDHALICQRFDWQCWEAPIGTALPEAAGASVTQLLDLRLQRRPSNLPPGAYFGVGWSNPDITSGGPYAARYQELPGDTYRLVVSRAGIMIPYNAYELLFLLHMALGHSIWLGLGLAVIYGHRRVDARRLSTISSVAGHATA